MVDERLIVFKKTVEGFLMVPYHYGGDDFSGIDCSGLVVEGLKAAGVINQDLSAEGLWQLFNKPAYQVPLPRDGALAFWFDDAGKAYHVAVCISWSGQIPAFCITADGGDSQTLTTDDAIKRNAFVKIRPISRRRTKPKFLYLFV